MAIYSCTCTIVSRSKGQSSVGRAAYINGEKIKNEYDGITHNYTKKSEIVHSEIILCENAPQAYKNRATLWNAVEQVEKGEKAQLARTYRIALPRELSLEENIQLTRNFVQDSFVSKGMCADFAIHDKGDGNPHAHILLTMRQIKENGEWSEWKEKKDYVRDEHGERVPKIDKETGKQKVDERNRKQWKREYVIVNEWNKPTLLKNSRADLAEKINRELEKKNLPQRVDHRSYEAQGIEKIPTIHVGVRSTAMERKGIETERGNINREIRETNSRVKALSFLQKSTQKEIDCIRDDMRWSNLHGKLEAIESTLPTMAEREKSLQGLQTRLEQLKQQAYEIKPFKASEGRTVDYDLRKVPYFEYHRNKVIGDISFIQDKVKSYLEALEQNRQEPAPNRNLQDNTAQPAAQAKPKPQEVTKPDNQETQSAFHVESTAQQLAMLRNEFVRETIRSKERTGYQENPIYRQQAGQIADLAKTISDQTRSIEALRAERDGLGMFKGKEKKVIQEKIDNFSMLREGNMQKMKALGVPDPSQADEAVKGKMKLAEHEKQRAAEAKQNEGAGSRAQEVKAVFLEVVKRIPADQRQEVLDHMEQYKEKPEVGRIAGKIEAFTAEAEARRQLDQTLKPRQEQERQREQNRTRWDDR